MTPNTTRISDLIAEQKALQARIAAAIKRERAMMERVQRVGER